MTPETVKQFQEAIGTACWNMNYPEFCRRLDRQEPDRWTAQMWGEFTALSQSLQMFDPATLAKLLTPAPQKIDARAMDPASGEPWTAEEILQREG